MSDYWRFIAETFNADIDSVTVLTEAPISAVCPCRSATSALTKLVLSISCTFSTAPSPVAISSCSELHSSGPLGPKPSRFPSITAATSHGSFVCVCLWRKCSCHCVLEFHPWWSTLNKHVDLHNDTLLQQCHPVNVLYPQKHSITKQKQRALEQLHW